MAESGMVSQEQMGLAEAAASEVGALSALARVESEIKTAIIVAHKFPRDESAAAVKILKSCSRPEFAEAALYKFPRGGSDVEGPSVDLAREMARCWGNLRYGIRIVSQDDEYVHIVGYCLDVETNTLVETEDKFRKLIYRKATQNAPAGWKAPDERDLRELINRRGAICERNAILKQMSPDITEEAVRASKETMRKAARGEIQQDKNKAIRSLLLAFDRIGVTQELIVKRLGHNVDVLTEDEIVDLRAILKSIDDGNSRREEYFEVNGTTAATSYMPRRAETQKVEQPKAPETPAATVVPAKASLPPAGAPPAVASAQTPAPLPPTPVEATKPLREIVKDSVGAAREGRSSAGKISPAQHGRLWGLFKESQESGKFKGKTKEEFLAIVRDMGFQDTTDITWGEKYNAICELLVPGCSTRKRGGGD